MERAKSERAKTNDHNKYGMGMASYCISDLGLRSPHPRLKKKNEEACPVPNTGKARNYRQITVFPLKLLHFVNQKTCRQG